VATTIALTLPSAPGMISNWRITASEFWVTSA
jgi:hypothetical protein